MYPYLHGNRALLALVTWSVLIVLGSQVVCAQDALTAKLLPQGGVNIMSGEKPLATLSLNAHGPEWKHVDQAEATATVKEADPGPGKIVEGTLPVPGTDGGAVHFVETIGPTAKGFSADYTLGVTKALALNGLQVSLLLPTSMFAGKTIVVHTRPAAPAGGEAAADETVSVTLPEQLDAEKWQLAASPASKIEIAAGADDAITLVPKVPAPKEGEAPQLPMFVIQDLRKWDQNMVEVRLFLIMDDNGKQVAEEDKMHVALDLTFAHELQWQ
jgi:hypothetical protein